MGKVLECAIEFAEEYGKPITSFETKVAFSRYVAYKSKKMGEPQVKTIRRSSLEILRQRQKRK